MFTPEDHWNKIYATKQANELSWTQDMPLTSLNFVHQYKPDKKASILDIGGGDSKLVDYLLNEGYENITVLDISAEALNRARRRLGPNAYKVHWIVKDITDFKPSSKYDFWHDRATFHFLTTEAQVQRYLDIARHALTENGYLTIGTFSDKGPKKCSGLDIVQYTEESLSSTLNQGFKKIKCILEDHLTPFHTIQNFLFCSFKKGNHSNPEENQPNE